MTYLSWGRCTSTPATQRENTTIERGDVQQQFAMLLPCGSALGPDVGTGFLPIAGPVAGDDRAR